MIVLFLTFGQDVKVHQQAVFSALTLLGQAGSVAELHVITDAPDYYTLLKDRITILPVSEDRLTEWKGPHDFFWRIKIKALEQLSRDNPGRHLMYLDADTFCFGELSDFDKVLASGSHLMHAREGKLAELPTSTERKMWKQCADRSFAGITVNRDSTMYNAGVVGLSAARANEAIDLALKLCDDMCAAGVTRRLIEQFALSVALAERGGVRAANGTIGHYWGNKAGWNERIANFFLEQHLKASPLTEQISAARAVDFREIPIYKRSSSTRNKLSHWVDATFEKQVYAYVPAQGSAPNDLSERRLARKV